MVDGGDPSRPRSSQQVGVGYGQAKGQQAGGGPDGQCCRQGGGPVLQAGGRQNAMQHVNNKLK